MGAQAQDRFGGKVKARWVPAALVTAAFVVVALVGSGGTLDASVLVWTAVGIFGLVFGITVVGSARHVDTLPSPSVKAHAHRIAAAHAPLVEAATAARATAAQDTPPTDLEALRALAVQATAEPEPALPRRAPKHSAELPV
ncbi:hypothetical protein GCM10012320_12350 [Sinomonas cellulolyticus]|nr:hypothetical protein GCM10012320_12350 [Sinomonas sp. KCTC 49339]